MIKKKLSRSVGTWAQALLALPLLLYPTGLSAADTKKPVAAAATPKAPAPKPAAAPARPAGAPAASGSPAARAPGAPAPGAPAHGASPAETHAPGSPASARAGAGNANPGAARSTTAPAAGHNPATAARVTPGSRPVPLRNGGEAHVNNRGQVTDLHRSGMDIHRSPNGARNIRVERADHSRVFVGRGGHGYVQHPYMYHGREFAHRTYYVNGRAYDRFYNRYQYHGVYLEGYAPVRYYAPAYYGWAYNPWVAPVPYTWGWVGNPWALYYGAYFAPYPVYPSAAFWLTDYLISASLAEAYQAQIDAANGVAPQPFAAPPTPLTPEVKQMISAEVQRQVALENAESQQVAKNTDVDPASSGVVRMLTDNASHVFVAGSDVDVIDARGQQCGLSHGDVIQLNPPNPPLAPDAVEANLVVLASKPQECMRGTSVSVQLADLQDMQNHMRESIDQGLGELQTNAGKGGLPSIPASAKAMPTPAPFAAIAPPPDPSAATEIAQQTQEADRAEQEVTGSAPAVAPPAPPPAPAKEPVTAGQTVDQVIANMGKPTHTFDANGKQIYTYKDGGVKITFRDGKVIDVQ
jgi:hypothetical protein